MHGRGKSILKRGPSDTIECDGSESKVSKSTGERARVDAAIEGDHALRAKTVNVSAVSFEMGNRGRSAESRVVKVSVLLDGQNLSAPGPLSDGSWTAASANRAANGPSTTRLTRAACVSGTVCRVP